MSGVAYIDSSGVGELVTAYVSVRKEGGDEACKSARPAVGIAAGHQTMRDLRHPRGRRPGDSQLRVGGEQNLVDRVREPWEQGRFEKILATQQADVRIGLDEDFAVDVV